ncbi:MAG: MarR family transcriptional regulator [Deltaproteobacteria bacterium HGW-Deltaproteobacteria-21]|nr:MAG: MarR family transcriptional regulator [Deltaproteobacteria bacterium HGW-Deltaproteobacteria-21]
MANDLNYKSNLSTDEKVLMAIVRAAEIFKRAHSALFRGYGLSFPQYNILRVLEASNNGHNRISDVSRIMLVPGANMTGIAKRLEKGGFIFRKSDPGDERVTMLEITPKARRTLQRIEKEKDEWAEFLLKDFSNEEKLYLLSKIRRLITNNVQVADKKFNQHKVVSRIGKPRTGKQGVPTD